jgi:transcriptional regulator with XRE-family HTH domain
LITGMDIRRYRQAIDANQTDFAKRLGVSQSALSQIERGTTAVSDAHIKLLKERFADHSLPVTFGDYLRKLEKGRSESQAALNSPFARYMTLAVWPWDEGFDLAEIPEPEQAVDMILIRPSNALSIAFRMEKGSSHWQQGDIFVFTQCGLTDIQDATLYLVQFRQPRARGVHTMIAAAHVTPAKRGQTVQFTPISPVGPVFTPERDLVLAVLKAVYFARHLP